MWKITGGDGDCREDGEGMIFARDIDTWWVGGGEDSLFRSYSCYYLCWFSFYFLSFAYFVLYLFRFFFFRFFSFFFGFNFFL